MPTIGTITSNAFRVRNPSAFRAWLTANVTFEGDIAFQDMGGDAVMLQIATESPSAMPRRQRPDHPGTDEWVLSEFADAIREHLQQGEEFRLLSCGVEPDRCCHAQHLRITASDQQFVDLYEGL
ncbi:MAG: hypothetical protein O9327_01945 [Polaromonas sp.]|nr:hypothetical protein [Polaromonas sp.]